MAQEARSHTPSCIGDGVFNKSLTVVLPVYNGETRLRKSVNEILELASELTTKFGVLIIDDGSNDSTYEVAEELASHFPQVKVRRHRHRRGLGSAIDYAQQRVRSDAVIVHDGVTPIDAGEIRSLWRQWAGQSSTEASGAAESTAMRGPISGLGNLTSMQSAMERAHGRLMGFQMIASAPVDQAFEDYEMTAATKSLRGDSPAATRKTGVGQIPQLPRPKFMRAIANFAWGE
jgi:Glycosyl transferase family 2